MADSADKSDWFTAGRFACLLALLVGGSFPGVLSGSESFVLRDYTLFGYPLAHFHRQCFWSGEVPLWNPLNHAGMPFLAQWNTLCLYPPSLIYLLFPLTWGLGLFCLIHLYAGGLGMYWLARDRTGCGMAGALAGVLYAFNGLTQTALMWPNNIAALGWLPWVLWLLDRAVRAGGRWFFGAILAGGVQMLSGAPEVILLTWVMGLVCWLGRGRLVAREIGRFVGIVALVSAVAAAQLLPFLDLLARSSRGGGGEAGWAMAADGWCHLFVPLYRTVRAPTGFHAQVDQFWTLSYYAGIAGLWFALMSWRASGRRREVLVWWLIGLGGLALALGENGVLYPLIGRLLPLEVMRYPVKFVTVLSVAVPLLAAYGIAERRRSVLVKWSVAEWGLILIGVLAVGLRIPAAEAFGDLRRDWMDSALVALLVLGGTALALSARRAYSVKVWGLVVLVICFTDLKTHSPGLTPTVAGAVLEEGEGQAMAGSGRYVVTRSVERMMRRGLAGDHVGETAIRRAAGLPNLNLTVGDVSVGGFYSLRLATEHAVTRRLHQSLDDVHTPLADFLGITSMVVADERGLSRQVRPAPEGLVSIGRRVRFAGDEETLRYLSSDAFQPREEVLLPLELQGRAEVGPDAEASAAMSRNGPNAMMIRTTSTKPAIAVIAESWHPNWRVRLDGAPAELLRVNHAFLGVVVPAGRHEVELVYRDRQFLIGALISVIALTIVCAGLLGKQKQGGQFIEPPRLPNLI